MQAGHILSAFSVICKKIFKCRSDRIGVNSQSSTVQDNHMHLHKQTCELDCNEL